MKKCYISILFYCCNHFFRSKKIVVDANGSGDFKTIQAAINSLPDSAAIGRTILIKNGTYNEKLFVEEIKYCI